MYVHTNIHTYIHIYIYIKILHPFHGPFRCFFSLLSDGVSYHCPCLGFFPSRWLTWCMRELTLLCSSVISLMILAHLVTWIVECAIVGGKCVGE
uniref:Uncharacterized protein n=1 Tax=Octopus bimaculoides TaxID=37653 RepID=A0A0L8HX81_OCTBM